MTSAMVLPFQTLTLRQTLAKLICWEWEGSCLCSSLLTELCRECRGLLFHKDTGELLARRYHKFFNIGESEETSQTTIDFSRPHVFTEKVDGYNRLPCAFSDVCLHRCMVTPVRTGGQIRLASKNGPTKFSALIEQNYLKQQPDRKFQEFFEEW